MSKEMAIFINSDVGQSQSFNARACPTAREVGLKLVLTRYNVYSDNT
jgi:hypothetical protein